MSEFTRQYLHKACEELDAAMFSGDAFIEKANRDRLAYYMARWQRHLPVWGAIETESAADQATTPPPAQTQPVEAQGVPVAEVADLPTPEVAARVLYDNWSGLSSMPSPARELASQGHFFSALRLLFEPHADLTKPPKAPPAALHGSEKGEA